MKKLILIAGLPRSGSTLLCQVLNQNPEFDATPTSGVLGTILSMKSSFANSEAWRMQERKEVYSDYLNGIKGFISGLYAEKNVVFDKNRSWASPNHIRLMQEIYGKDNVKIIYTYRNPLHVLCSVEHAYQKTALLPSVDETKMPNAYVTMSNRVEHYLSDKFIVTPMVRNYFDVLNCGLRKNIHIVPYDAFCSNPASALHAIHEFIGEEWKEGTYDFKNVKQTTHEDDNMLNYKFSHKIKEGEITNTPPKMKFPPNLEAKIISRYKEFIKSVLEGIPTQETQKPELMNN